MIEIVSQLHDSIPPFIAKALESPAMRRLRHVGMNCGCEYTSYECFTVLPPYSRYEHSLGVALIVWHFTKSEKQALAGLFHDIATPVFAHVIDFMRGDYEKQEATEFGTKELIGRDPVIREVLRECGLTMEDVCDYHVYPVADTDSPKLCADRLEYTLENMVHYHHASVEEALRMYHDLMVSENEYGEEELMFRTPSLARQFAAAALKCGRFYTTDQDRYSMQRLAEICRDAIRRNVITEADLYTDEPQVIGRFLSDPETAERWQAFRQLHAVYRASSPEGVLEWRKIPAKKRFIDPYVLEKGRVSGSDPAFRKEMLDFQHTAYDWFVAGE